MKTKLSVLFIMISVVASFAQGEANNWYFGQNAAITFNSGTPVALTNSAMQTNEGCATLSDATGQLLFYTDGDTVYNKNHQIMVNGTGLMGHESSTQSGTIIPLPGSNHLFYVFTLDAEASPNGFRYSIIDLNLDGGLGAVTSTKNILVYTPSCEKISVVKHANNVDYWILTHAFGSNTFYSHLLSSSGLSNAPTLSNIGFSPLVVVSTPNGTPGAMKISPNGQKLAVCYSRLHPYAQNILELYDFNNNTGQITNAQTLMSYSSGYIYGVEFSPNNNILYVSSNNPEYLYQFDLTSANISASLSTLFQGTSTSNYYPRALQLGPDGKIYIAMGSNPFLGCINNPNILGAGCNFVPNQVDLLGNKPALGLPVFNQSYFAPAIQFQNACVGESVQFELSNSSVISATWDFGDGNTSTNLTPSHVYSLSGTYSVAVTATSSYGTGVTTRDIVISEVPTATQPNTILECDTDNNGFFNFDLTQNDAAILNGQSTTQFGVNYYANAMDFANKTKITNPTSYENTSLPYQAQTIIAEVYNIENNSCNATTSFDIQVFESPVPSITVLPIEFCDNTSFGTDTDGRVVFDLRVRENDVLNGQSASTFTVEYYRDSTLTNLIVTPNNYVNINATETIYVKVFNTQNPSCFATTSFEVRVFDLPVVNSPISLKQCDDDNDGFSAFNLTEANELISSTTTGFIFSYFETSAQAQSNSNPITDFTTYTNQTVSTDQIFVRVENANGCFRVVTLNLIVSTTLIPASFQRNFTVCDDALSGSNTDGIATFDFSSVTGEIQALYPVGQVLDITYYKNQVDALAEQNAITDISNYTNTGYPNSQDIYVRVDSQLNNECLGLGHHITLNVEALPLIQSQSYTQCDEDQDGIFGFDTTTIENDVLNGLTNVTVQYWDANNIALPSPLPNPFNTISQVVKVRVTNNTATACFYESTITFTVDDLPEAFAVAPSLTTVCDDEANPVNQDGLYAFDTSSFQTTILGSQTGMIVNYYDENGNSLSSPLPNPFTTATQNVLVEVINPINTNCIATMTIPFIVNPLPEIELYGEELVCSNDPSFTKVINAGLLDEITMNDFSYTWFLNGTQIASETSYDLTVNIEGIYTVEVINLNGCVRTRTITVTASDIATVNNVQVTDLSNDNSIIVFVSGQGDYEFSLDNMDYQSDNTFNDIEAGVYTVFVKDLNGCGIATREVSVLGIPNYFTPNGDGYNDTWNIKGVNARLNAGTIIYIFDRYGKLLKQISPLGEGWDGTFNGHQLPSSDYWYTIQLEDGRIVKGHFTLKR
ncbi:T9SS type B sorting domain-containing protein [Flavobacterium sp.]|uniref:T9SS type B sorting domain-containing protein n=1 Tax=Flavobacterium sp. TaxID=239 RepID=UPI003D27D32C